MYMPLLVVVRVVVGVAVTIGAGAVVGMLATEASSLLEAW